MSFEALPRELQLIIITEYLRPAPPEPNASRFARFFCVRPEPRPTLDVDLALQLAIISPSCRNIVSGLLLRHVRITRPSALRQLCSTLSRRPELASLISSIHLGPVRNEEVFYWPFLDPREGPWPFMRIRATLTKREQTLLPNWCQRGTIFHSPPRVQNCVYAAVDRAVGGAVEGLDVEPTRQGYSRSGIVIGLREWVARCFLLVAALDLYLIHMRRLEDSLDYDVWGWKGSGASSEACANSICGHAYPRYQVSFERCKLPSTGQDFSVVGSSDNGKTLTVTEAQLWAQQERPGGPADDFNHLTFFTNSTRSGLDMSERDWQRVRAVSRGPCPEKFTNIDWLKRNGYDPYDELIEPTVHPEDGEDEDDEGWPHPSSSASEDFDMGKETRSGRTDRAEDLLNMARRLLSLATEVENLSLTGIFFRALPALQARSLRALTIGPSPYYWNDVLPFEAVVRLRSLVKLRMVGNMSKEDASRIAYELPRLEHFEWEMIERRAPLRKIYDNVRALQGLRNLADSYAGRGAGSPRKRLRYSSEGNTNASSLACSGGGTINAADSVGSSGAPPPIPLQRRTLVLLRRENVREVCSMTPFEEVRASWQGDGRRLEHNLHGVKVEASEAADSDVAAKGGHNFSREVAALYAAGRRWQEGNSGEGVFGREGCEEGGERVGGGRRRG